MQTPSVVPTPQTIYKDWLTGSSNVSQCNKGGGLTFVAA